MGGDVEEFIPINAIRTAKNIFDRQLWDFSDVLLLVHHIIVLTGDCVNLGYFLELLFLVGR